MSILLALPAAPTALRLLGFVTLIVLFLVCGVFWGNWLSLSRSFHKLSVDELKRIEEIVGSNLASSMRYLSSLCLTGMALSAFYCSSDSTVSWFLMIAAIGLLLVSVLITLFVEVPINHQFASWTSTTAPSNWESVRDRWQRANGYRVMAAVGSFACYSAALLTLS